MKAEQLTGSSIIDVMFFPSVFQEDLPICYYSNEFTKKEFFPVK